MVGNIVKTVLVIALLSLVAGMIMDFFGLSPREVYLGAIASVRDAAHGAVSAIGWAWHYILLGAAIVVPIWVIVYLLRLKRRRS